MTPDSLFAQILLSVLAALALACIGLSLLLLAAFVRGRWQPQWARHTRAGRLLTGARSQRPPQDRVELEAGDAAAATPPLAAAQCDAVLARPAGIEVLRLQAHQQAFVLWQRHLRASDNRHLLESLQQCRAWWEEHCLYLEPTVRVAFAEACVHARLRSVLLQLGDHPQLIEKALAKIEAFPDVLCAALATTPLSEVERSRFLHFQPDARVAGSASARSHAADMPLQTPADARKASAPLAESVPHSQPPLSNPLAPALQPDPVRHAS